MHPDDFAAIIGRLSALQTTLTWLLAERYPAGQGNRALHDHHAALTSLLSKTEPAEASATDIDAATLHAFDELFALADLIAREQTKARSDESDPQSP